MEPPQSLWWSTLPEPVVARRALKEHLDVDVAIVGGGFTGLWTARELLRRDKTLRVAVLEQSVCGFGASGRNGGWASALYPQSGDAVIAREGRAAYDDLRAQLRQSVVALGDALTSDGIDAHYVRGGTLVFARSALQAQRLQRHVEASRELGDGADDLTWLDTEPKRANEASSPTRSARPSRRTVRGSILRVLVRGLADAVEHLGGQIFENTKVTRILAARRGHAAEVVTEAENVHASVVVRATEGFTPTLPGERRASRRSTRS